MVLLVQAQLSSYSFRALTACTCSLLRECLRDPASWHPRCVPPPGGISDSGARAPGSCSSRQWLELNNLPLSTIVRPSGTPLRITLSPLPSTTSAHAPAHGLCATLVARCSSSPNSFPSPFLYFSCLVYMHEQELATIKPSAAFLAYPSIATIVHDTYNTTLHPFWNDSPLSHSRSHTVALYLRYQGETRSNMVHDPDGRHPICGVMEFPWKLKLGSKIPDRIRGLSSSELRTHIWARPLFSAPGHDFAGLDGARVRLARLFAM